MIRDLKPYPAYKDSGVQWLGEVPEHWEVLRLKRCAMINPRRSDTSDVLAVDSEVTFLPMERVGTDGRIDSRERRRASEVWNGFTYFRRADVLVAKITPCFENGKGACLDSLPTEVGFGSTEFHVLRASSSVLPQFLYRVTTLVEFRQIGTKAMTGAAGQQRVPESFVANFQSPLPPLPEQAAIVRFLDHVDRRIRRYIRAKQKLIALLNEQKQVIIHRAVTRGLDPNVRLKPSGVEWLGDVPEHWQILRVKNLARLKSGEDITSFSISESGQYPVYGGNGIRGYTSGYTHDGEFVLIGRQGALCGNINYAKGRFWASEHAVVVHARQPFELYWLGELLRTMNLNRYSLAAAQPGLAVERIGDLRLPVPPPDEQATIARHMQHATAELDLAVSSVCREIDLLREYRTRLIADVVTGKLDVREVAAGLPEEAEEPEPLDEAEALEEGEAEESTEPDVAEEVEF
ncbi:MAG: restriction endonuclease subunit S [Bacteroidota bacterium]